MIDKDIIKKYVKDHGEMMRILAEGAKQDQVEKKFYCPICKEHFDETSEKFDIIITTGSTPICNTCGSLLHYNYVYK